jgi:hypothetical protein
MIVKLFDCYIVGNFVHQQSNNSTIKQFLCYNKTARFPRAAFQLRNLCNLHLREGLAVTDTLLIAHLRLVVNHGDLLVAAVFHDLSFHLRVLHERGAHVHLGAVRLGAEQYLERNLVAGLAREALELHRFAFADNILFAAGLNNRNHSAEIVREYGGIVKTE